MVTVNIFVSPFLPLVVCVCVGSSAVVVVVVGMCVEQYGICGEIAVIYFISSFSLFLFSFNIVVSASGSAVVVVVDVGMEGMQ